MRVFRGPRTEPPGSDRPVLSDATGSNAGSVNWSPYQEFNVSFSPDYSGNGLLLTSDFLNALRDNTLFHFWSGATVTYRVTKSGGSVTGTVV